ncbi:MAG TPA: hypothetical protein VFQ77_01890 [Pseudonocardiaceae bacterium]|nr:hypothetical protein [Pseudonocardiaceae bacterium]
MTGVPGAGVGLVTGGAGALVGAGGRVVPAGVLVAGGAAVADVVEGAGLSSPPHPVSSPTAVAATTATAM